MLQRCIELCVLLCLTAGAARAQHPLVSRTLDSATVVRLSLFRDGPVTGVLLAPLDTESRVVVIAPPAHRDCGVPRVICRIEVPVAEIRRVEVPGGSQAGRGALIGALFGGVAGLALGATVAGREPVCLGVGPCGGGASDAAGISFMTLVGTGLGAGIGALVGLGSPNWRPAP